jgi:hypothetical protein
MAHVRNSQASTLQHLAARSTTFIGLTLLSGFATSALAATLCVNPTGTGGCSSTISKAVAAASAGDTITVAPGWYREDVVIGKPLSIIGANNSTTFIDAQGKSNAIYIDGFDSPTPLAHVTVSGISAVNAKYEGILAHNVSNVTISNNLVHDNNVSLDTSSSTYSCPGLPPFETNEASDCGEGIHLIGVDHSIVYGNDVHNNSGGILVSDETAINHDNVITGNHVHGNPWACGITLASHPGYVKTGTAPLAFGMDHNTVSKNVASENGFAAGGGAGIGIYAAGPGNVNIDNSIVDNEVEYNGLPGIALHNHAYLTFPNHPPNPVLDNNVIVGNYIADNGPDPDLPTTVNTGLSVLGTTPILGLVIANNTFVDESIDIATDSASSIDLHLNNFSGYKAGIDNLNPAGIDNATENWWGCATGPGATGCTSIIGGATVIAIPPLTAPAN